KEQVRAAIPVEIEDRAARTHRLDHVAPPKSAVRMTEAKPGRRRRILKAELRDAGRQSRPGTARAHRGRAPTTEGQPQQGEEQADPPQSPRIRPQTGWCLPVTLSGAMIMRSAFSQWAWPSAKARLAPPRCRVYCTRPASTSGFASIFTSSHQTVRSGQAMRNMRRPSVAVHQPSL